MPALASAEHGVRWAEVVLEVLGREPKDGEADAEEICEVLGIRTIGPRAALSLLTHGYGLPAAVAS